MMSSTVSNFKGVQVPSKGAKPVLTELMLRKLGKNEILVRMEYTPINPVDFMCMGGYYPAFDTYPGILGREGSGIVQELGDHLEAHHKVGDRVAIFDSTGSWANYAIVNSTSAFKIPDNVTMEQASMHYVNPWVVELMVLLLKEGGHKACIHTAAASSVGKKLIKRLKLEGIKLINLVRREALVKELEPLHPDFVINTEKPDWEQELKKLCHENAVTMCFDAIAGDFTEKMLLAMPNGGNVRVYGALGGGQVEKIGVVQLAFEGKSVGGLWLEAWTKGLSHNHKQKIAKTVFAHMNDVYKSDIDMVMPLEEWEKAIKENEKSRTKGKILLKLN